MPKVRFTIYKEDIHAEQAEKIRNHVEVAKGFDYGEDQVWFEGEPWVITESEDMISGEGDRDGFEMYQFLLEIDVDEARVEWHTV